MWDDEGLSLSVPGNTDPLPVLLARLAPVPISKASVALVQQVAHQLGQKCLMGTWRGRLERFHNEDDDRGRERVTQKK